MVQKATQTTYLDMTSFQSQGGKVSGSNDNKGSFSQALDKEMSQDKQPVSNDKTDKAEEQPKAENEKPEETKQPETEQTTNDKTQEEQPKEETPEDAAAAQLAAQLQQLQLQQSAQAQQITEAPAELVAETEVQQTVSTLTAAVTEEQTSQIQQTAVNAETQTVLGEESAEGMLMGQTKEAVAAIGQEADTLQTQQQQTAETAGQQTQQNMQTEQPLQNSQAESRNASGMTEAVSQAAQGQTQQTVSTTQQPVQTQTVNMSWPQQGVQNMARTMAENIKQGVNEFEIWLEPANLGKIGVKVTYEGGRAMISIMCMSDKAMEIVAQNSKTLGAIIQQNTGNDTIVVIEQPEQQDYLQQESQKQERGEEQQEEQQEDRGSNEEDAETQSFLQQLRLGLK